MEPQDEPTPQIESPISLLPDLSLWGIEEVDRGVCEDSAQNRRLIRDHESTWIMVYTTDGRPTNLIQVVTPQMKEARLLTNKSILLTEPLDSDSDYLTGWDLVSEEKADDVVPAWVLAATRHWNNVEEERERRGVDGKMYRPHLTGPPARCRARRLDGHRCENWQNGERTKDGLCKTHLSTKWSADDNIGANMVARAKARLLSATVIATEVLEDIAQNAVSEPSRVQAANSILDRSGIRGGLDIDAKIEIKNENASEIVMKRINDIAARLEQRRLEEATATPEATPEVHVPEELEAVVIEENTDDKR